MKTKKNNEEPVKNKPTTYTLANIKIAEFMNYNEANKISYSSFIIEKFYSDEKGEWKTTQTFNLGDLKTLYFLLNGLFNTKLQPKMSDEAKELNL